MEKLCKELACAFPSMLGIEFTRTEENSGWLFPGLIVKIVVNFAATDRDATRSGQAIFEWEWGDFWKAYCEEDGHELYRDTRVWLKDAIEAAGVAQRAAAA